MVAVVVVVAVVGREVGTSDGGRGAATDTLTETCCGGDENSEFAANVGEMTLISGVVLAADESTPMFSLMFNEEEDESVAAAGARAATVAATVASF